MHAFCIFLLLLMLHAFRLLKRIGITKINFFMSSCPMELEVYEINYMRYCGVLSSLISVEAVGLC